MAFDCLVHDLLIAKLNAYGFDHKAVALVYCYLSNKNRGLKFVLPSVTGLILLRGFLKGLFLVPLYLIYIYIYIYINDIFYFNEVTNITKYADDNTIHV